MPRNNILKNKPLIDDNEAVFNAIHVVLVRQDQIQAAPLVIDFDNLCLSPKGDRLLLLNASMVFPQ
ncbi:hypothetical protein C8R31_102403 [Nitrosospira sp. Nsp2]|nr:hypothetical protein C8R31_102403 [Nitrosospira sp. Nsp2]